MVSAAASMMTKPLTNVAGIRLMRMPAMQ